MSQQPDLDLIRDALLTSTLSHALKLIGDRWTMQILMGAFMGVKRFDDFQTKLGIPRRTLSERLKAMVQMDLLRPRLYQERPERFAYHLTHKGMAIYEATLMTWDWEQRFGENRIELPTRLVHKTCGHGFMPQMTCEACGEVVTLRDLDLGLKPNPHLPHDPAAPMRTPKVTVNDGAMANLALRMDRWTLMIISALILGCRHFDQIAHVLRISPPLLSRRLTAMIDAGLMTVEPDREDGRRRVYLLTAASRGLFPYIVLLSTWSSEHLFNEQSSIRPRHKACGKAFIPRATCGHCHDRLKAWDVRFETGETA
ncbi:winged helix-turn-helix transcriptional regulator [Pararhodobacter zhoushanensis]|uniref:Helix-turn-helix transcriptional regulator n=1 Tax=Pararhodobacter zhoushanensis TaxID=2479545 RepID=A0ABT3GTC8_9RHOB|nr:helix-turn-helix domain-containing protein [Pararhodobacter zhoushanensis]MCW1930798.1 helix-turn-helix transcriptional regulator [Pararhodobacter zhoushanensis]